MRVVLSAECGGTAVGRRLFDSPERASHSMPQGYSFALEYARSACWRDCTSTMLSRKGFTFRDPRPAVVLAMQRMATIVALMRREPLCPPVRMV
ncbi:hypothetical protein AMK11_20710 [Streptomyces sp. CB02414]|nr:hypothetical protein AMK11_20710 [Streptomyces sp. CB02414]